MEPAVDAREILGRIAQGQQTKNGLHRACLLIGEQVSEHGVDVAVRVRVGSAPSVRRQWAVQTRFDT